MIYRDDENGNGDIYESRQKGITWTEPEKLPEPVNSKSHESSASIAPDGRTIYFVSDRVEGGKGGRDIWYCTKDESGKWGKAVNIGEPINTKTMKKPCLFILMVKHFILVLHVKADKVDTIFM